MKKITKTAKIASNRAKIAPKRLTFIQIVKKRNPTQKIDHQATISDRY